MNKQEFNFIKINLLNKRGLKFAVDCNNYLNGWEDCIRELEKYFELKIDDILKLKK